MYTGVNMDGATCAPELYEEEEEAFIVTHAFRHPETHPEHLTHPNSRISGQPAYGAHRPPPAVGQCGGQEYRQENYTHV